MTKNENQSTSICEKETDVLNTEWGMMYQKLKDYFETNAHSDVSSNDDGDRELCRWIMRQRFLYNKEFLSLDKVELLNRLNFDWNPIETQWQEMYQELKEYYSQYGNCNVPLRYEEKSSLGRWVTKQRQDYKKGELSQDKINLLNQLNFDWNPTETQWNEMYQQLKDYFNQYQHCNIPLSYKENPRLGGWVAKQRRDYKNSKLSQEKTNLLNRLNFVWDPIETKWEEKYQELKNYFESNGHLDLSYENEEQRQLVIWTRKQRQAYEQEKLAPDKIERLNQLNFDWNPLETKWEEKYQQLKEYFETHKNLNNLTQYHLDDSLEKWIHYQRTAYKANKLSQERIELLNQLNFDWNPFETQWQVMYQQLKEYFEQYNHSNVPQYYKENNSLGFWVRKQRMAYKRRELSQDKIDQLNQLNFDWDPLKTQWKAMYQQLKEYFEQHNHSNVPQRYQSNKALGIWVNNQRLAYKRNRLSQERIDLLSKLDFDWKE